MTKTSLKTSTASAKSAKAEPKVNASAMANMVAAVTVPVTAEVSAGRAKSAAKLAKVLNAAPDKENAYSGLNKVAPSFALSHIRGHGKALPPSMGTLFTVEANRARSGSADSQLMDRVLNKCGGLGNTITAEELVACNVEAHNMRAWLKRGWLKATGK